MAEIKLERLNWDEGEYRLVGYVPVDGGRGIKARIEMLRDGRAIIFTLSQAEVATLSKWAADALQAEQPTPRRPKMVVS